MKGQEYSEIVGFIASCNCYKCLPELQSAFPSANTSTLWSIYSQEMQKLVKKKYHTLIQYKTAKGLYEKYANSVENNSSKGTIIKLALELGFSPAMLAKIILEQYVLSEMPESHTVSKSFLNSMLRDTTQIQDKVLAHEVYLCLIYDDVYGPYADSIKHSIGYEYEFLLKQKLKELNINYQDEEFLRSKGYDKTPDVKLDVPFAIGNHVVNWIESKASFGDEENHHNYLKNQFWSYWNRFGPGLVIYWFGFIEELDVHKEKGIMLSDSFPANITFMDPLSVVN